MAIKGTNNGYSIIHEATDADTANFAYYKVYAGSNATPTINGTVVNMSAGSDIEINIREISATANVFVIGEPINVVTGNITLSNTPTA